MLHRTKVKQTDLGNEGKLVKDHGQFINYYRDHLIIEAKAVYHVEDDIMGKINKDFDFKIFIPKYAPLEFSLNYEVGEYYYAVRIGEWRLFFDFKHKEEAERIFEELTIWKSGE